MNGMLFLIRAHFSGTLIAKKPASLGDTYVTYMLDPGYQYPYRSDINGVWSGIQIDLSTGAPTEITTSTDYSLAVGKSTSYTAGGTYRERNLRLAVADKKVYSDVDGINTATSVRPSVAYKQVGFPVWTFDSWVGPALPISRLASTQNVIARMQYLTEAGFKVTNLGNGTLYAAGTYKTLNMRMTTEGQTLMSNSLGFLKPSVSLLRVYNSGTNGDYNPMSFSATIGYFIN